MLQDQIRTTNKVPIFVKQYRYPPVHKEKTERQVNKLLEDKIIEDSPSPYNSPLWIIPEKNDSKGNKKMEDGNRLSSILKHHHGAVVIPSQPQKHSKEVIQPSTNILTTNKQTQRFLKMKPNHPPSPFKEITNLIFSLARIKWNPTPHPRKPSSSFV